MQLTAQQIQDIGELERMFQFGGWEAFKRHHTESLEAMEKSALANIQNEHQLYFAKGYTTALRQIINFDAFIEAVRLSQDEGESTDASDSQ